MVGLDILLANKIYWYLHYFWFTWIC